MLSFISRLVLRIAAIRWVFKLGGLGLLIPIALLLKTIGLPILLVLMVLALPVLALLFLFGLPIFLVVIAGGMLMGFLGMVLTIGIAAIKFGVFVVLPIWLFWRLCCWIFRQRPRGGDDTPGAGTEVDPSDVPPSDTSSSTSTPIDPLVDPLD
ncbi:MAG TPA: hypothetical protein VGM50_13035 [Gemmatimonadaceae bacterium]|jgi:hypothetical protein